MAIQNPSFLAKLEQAGFSDKEALVYVSLLELGGGFPSQIAGYSRLNRTTVYKILENLLARGVVGETEKRNKLFYHAEKPENALRYARTRVTEAEDAAEALKRILPNIDGIYQATRNQPKIAYFEGVEGVLSIYRDQTSNVKPYEMLLFANAGELKRYLPVEFYVTHVRAKADLGITTRSLIPDSQEDRTMNTLFYKDIDQKFWPVTRFVPQDKFPLTGEITIYGDKKVSIVNFQKDQMTGILIEDAAIHGMLRTVFELSWSSTGIKD